MQLPGLFRATVPERKAVRYLLARNHPTGRYKALWLFSHGFSTEDWEVLASALRRHAATHQVARIEDSVFGKCYVIEGSLMTPDGRNPLARSVWFIESGDNRPQLVTVYPLRGRQQ